MHTSCPAQQVPAGTYQDEQQAGSGQHAGVVVDSAVGEDKDLATKRAKLCDEVGEDRQLQAEERQHCHGVADLQAQQSAPQTASACRVQMPNPWKPAWRVQPTLTATQTQAAATANQTGRSTVQATPLAPRDVAWLLTHPGCTGSGRQEAVVQVLRQRHVPACLAQRVQARRHEDKGDVDAHASGDPARDQPAAGVRLVADAVVDVQDGGWVFR